MKETEEKGGAAGYGTYFYTWVCLLILTVLTVTVSAMRIGRFSVLTAVAIASVKAWLVLSIFMHLRYEKRIFKVMVFIAVATLAVFIGMTFFDVLYR